MDSWLATGRIKRNRCTDSESTDITSVSNLLAYVRYENNSEVKEEFLFSRSLPTRSTAEAIFDILNTFIISNGIDWSKCVGLSTDGARAIMGKHSGDVRGVQAVAPNVTSVHCNICPQLYTAECSCILL